MAPQRPFYSCWALSKLVLACRVPPKIYFKGGSLDTALRELSGKKRAFIVTDRGVFKMGTTDRVTEVLDEISVHHQVCLSHSCLDAGGHWVWY